MFKAIPYLWRALSSRRRKQLCWLLVVMMVASFAEVISIGLVLPFLGAMTSPETLFDNSLARPIISALKLDRPEDLLLPLTVLFITASIASAASRVILLCMQTRISHAIGSDFSMQIYRRTLYQPYEVHLNRNSSEVMSGIVTKVNQVVNRAVSPLIVIASSTLIIVTILAALITVEPQVALIAFGGFGLVYIAITMATKRRLTRNSKEISQNSNRVIKVIQEGLGGIRDVMIDGTQRTYCTIYNRADHSLRRAQANNQIIAGTPRFLIESLGISLIAVLAYGLAVRDDEFNSAIPTIGALTLGVQRLLPVMQQFYSGLSSLRGGQDTLHDVLKLLNQPLPSYINEKFSGQIEFQNIIRFNKVGFRYSKQSLEILGNVNFEIKKGSRVGFVGTTGGGKSTLLDIVMGLLVPTSGSIEIDGIIINEKNRRAWQAHIAHVPQQIFLADASIAENIAFGVPLDHIDMPRVRKAAEQAQIARMIESLGDGYHTFVGERGIRLSGGQRQRIGIARALYKQTSIIIFDEATSALDNETEAAVMDAINNIASSTTILAAAHRLSTLRDFDTIYRITNGTVIEYQA
jgi:ABC-type multidrug transport system fused ATPase/permease subunit